MEEALATERQVVSLLEAQRDRNPDFPSAIAYERNALAERLTEAGHEAEAKTILEEDLIHAEPKGRESPEYQGALSWLLHNRIQAKDYDAAEKLAKEAVRLAESGGAAPDSAQWVAAISTLAEVRRDQGYATEAEELIKRSLAPQEPEGFQKRIEAIEALVRGGRPEAAFVEIQQITEATDSPNPNESFYFQWLAQLFVTFGYKPEAAKVAALAVPLEENRLRSDDPRLAYALTDWAGFYRGASRAATSSGYASFKSGENRAGVLRNGNTAYGTVATGACLDGSSRVSCAHSGLGEPSGFSCFRLWEQ